MAGALKHGGHNNTAGGGRDHRGDDHHETTSAVLDYSARRAHGVRRHPTDHRDDPVTAEVRIWIADDELAARVGANYNTRGEKVNESTAKYKAPEGSRAADRAEPRTAVTTLGARQRGDPRHVPSLPDRRN